MIHLFSAIIMLGWVKSLACSACELPGIKVNLNVYPWLLTETNFHVYILRILWNESRLVQLYQ